MICLELLPEVEDQLSQRRRGHQRLDGGFLQRRGGLRDLLVRGGVRGTEVEHLAHRIVLPIAIASMGLQVLKTPVRTPQANAFCERLIGTMRRECPDWLIPLNDRLSAGSFLTG